MIHQHKRTDPRPRQRLHRVASHAADSENGYLRLPQPLQPAEDTGEETAGRRSLPGSVAFVPSVAGLLLASEVVKDLCRFTL